LKQQGNRLEGSHQGDFVSRDLSGSIDGDNVQISSRYTERHGDSLMFTFSGKAGANEMSGSSIWVRY
jgi:L-seryl-tRNA(Ser) seleniumtransferase